MLHSKKIHAIVEISLSGMEKMRVTCRGVEQMTRIVFM